MAQDFERYGQHAVGTSAVAIHTSDSNDAIISIRLANTTTSTINAEYIYYIFCNRWFTRPLHN